MPIRNGKFLKKQTLLKKSGLQSPDKIILAGGFGSYIDKEKAMLIGLIPDCELDRVYAVGNAAENAAARKGVAGRNDGGEANIRVRCEKMRMLGRGRTFGHESNSCCWFAASRNRLCHAVESLMTNEGLRPRLAA